MFSLSSYPKNAVSLRLSPAKVGDYGPSKDSASAASEEFEYLLSGVFENYDLGITSLIPLKVGDSLSSSLPEDDCKTISWL